VSLFVLVIFGCTGIREDELVCENAVSHLQSCCSGFTGSNIDCTYSQGGCEDNTVYPELTASQSACIQAESCDELVSTGVCARAIALPANWTQAQFNENYQPPTPQVCP
jgi:hypothetical protein